MDEKKFGVVDRTEEFEKEEKHEMWHVLEETVVIDGARQMVSNAIKIYTRSLFDAINDHEPSEIKYFSFYN